VVAVRVTVVACATSREEGAARASGLTVARVGVGASLGVPDEPAVSFGLAGALTDELQCGTVVDATRVVDADGRLLWQGDPLGVPGARQATVLAADAVVDDPAERRRLHEATGAVAADLETGPLARAGRLAGCLRVVSDTPARPLGRIAVGTRADGRVRWRGVVSAFVLEPVRAMRATRDALRALEQLRRAGEALA